MDKHTLRVLREDIIKGVMEDYKDHPRKTPEDFMRIAITRFAIEFKNRLFSE